MTINGQWLKDTSGKIANWYWISESNKKHGKTRFVFEYISHYVVQYNIISLRYDQVKMWYQQYHTIPDRKVYMTLNRVE